MKKVYSILFLLLVSVSVFAVPASPDPVTVTYDDGRSLTYFVKGDENVSWVETIDGYQIKESKNGKFEYIQQGLLKTASDQGVIAHDPQYRDDKEATFVSQLQDEVILSAIPADKMKMGAPLTSPFDQTEFPTLGSRKFLCILVDFSDKRFTHSNEDFDSLFNAKDYTYNYAIGSVNEYYRTTSFGQFDPTFDIAGPFTLDSSYAYYGKDEGGDTDVNIQKFVYDAVRAADPTVNFADYDLDGDGYVDNIYFIYAGYGQASGAPSNTIWPHRWAYWASTLYVDGKYVYDYSTSNELLGVSGTTRTSIGVICHEFGHVCGLPDFYDTDYGDSGGDCDGLGRWDEMAGGSWNDGGRRPPIFNAWSRMYLRWATPVELSGSHNVTLNPAYTHNESYYFMSPTEDEFFMVENRQQVGFDENIPGHGMVVFHVDMNHPGWGNNKINANPDYQGFDLEEADGLGNPSSGYASSGDPFPGTTHNTMFLDTGSPNAQDWDGNPSRKPIRNIEETDGVITFSFGDPSIDAPSNLSLSASGYDSIRVAWTLNAESDSVMIVWSTSPITSFPQNYLKYEPGDAAAGGEVIYKGIDTVYYHTGLPAGVQQYYAVYSFDDSSYAYSEKIAGTAKTQSPPFFSTDFSQGLPEGWVVYDRYGNGTFSAENPENRTLASTTSSNGFITMDSEHAGDKLVDAEMITQSFNFALARSVIVKFQHKLEVENTTLARLQYTINNGLSWFEVKRWSSNTADPELAELDLSAEIAGFRDVIFKFSYIGSNEKYWCIDDFEITAAQDTGLSSGFHTGTVSGSKPLTVSFMNTSVSGPDSVDSYIWEFGDDGQFYYEKEPTHTYVTSGVFTVSLSAIKNGDVSNFSRQNYIEVINDAPVVILESDTLNIKINESLTLNLYDVFQDPNGDPLNFSWAGYTSNIQVEQDDSLITFTPISGYTGIESFDFVAMDNEYDSTSHSIDIWVSETGISNALPAEFNLSQNYPNPFNPVTMIAFQLPANEVISLNIYDLSGNKIRTLIDGFREAGYYSVSFNAGDLPSGVYLYRLIAGNEIVTKKMVLMK